MTQASFQPPRGAVWLIELFTPYEQAESIPGDLLEEFSDLASKSGVAYARLVLAAECANNFSSD